VDGKCAITVDLLLADEGRRTGWIKAIELFQIAVMKTSNDH
jgi:hypothetical protein